MLQKQYIHSTQRTFSADLVTPILAYMRMRNFYAKSILLESSEYNNRQNSRSIIGVNPIYELCEQNDKLAIFLNHKLITHLPFTNETIESSGINFFDSVKVDYKGTHTHNINGFLGYQNFKIFSMAENLHTDKKQNINIPHIQYAVYEYVIVFDHFKQELSITHNQIDNVPTSKSIDEIYHHIHNAPIREESFSVETEESSDCTEGEFLKMVEYGKMHCRKGDVFQLVLSRHFSKAYTGDAFTLYRRLRAINPSPYLFYCDYVDYQLIGSSPEAQIIIDNQNATLNPIAGTYLRTGNDDLDFINAQKLLQDKKENAEHTMLVDLARNDLSKFCDEVKVTIYKTIQMYSHVIHIVSRVTGKMRSAIHPFSALLAVSPAGTLSGAPKHRAIQLIEQYEKSSRSFYAGSIGLLDFDGGLNQAIIIRTALTKDNRIHYRAGAGIVDASIPQLELEEVYNKISAIKKCFS